VPCRANKRRDARPVARRGRALTGETWCIDARENRPSARRVMLVHSVYFWLKPELTPAQRAEFRRGVESLAGIKAVAAVHVGTPAATPKRATIDDTYSVALTVLCKDVAAHDAYQVDPLHLAFVTTFKSYWTRVQIYDAA
jgi:hypothetical protein